MQKFKVITCKNCGVECRTGKRNLCNSCYSKEQQSKLKTASSLKPQKSPKNQEELDKIKKQKLKEKELKRKEREKKKREDKKLSKTEMLKVLQKLARYVGSQFCCTCGNKFSSSLIANGGHGIRASKGMSTALLLRNIHEQCSRCNNIGQGEQFKYSKFVDNKYGNGTFSFLEDLSNIQFKLSKDEMQELRIKAEEYIRKSEHLTKFEEKDKLRYEFINWQENTNWYKRLIEIYEKKINHWNCF